MLSDDAIENLMQPIIDRQENINNFIIGTIAKKLKKLGTLQPDDINKLQIMLEVGGDAKKINNMVATQSGYQIKDIKSVIKTVAKDSYLDAKPFYDYRHKSFIPLEKNAELRKITSAISKRTADTYINLSDTRMMGFVRKRGNKLRFSTVTQTYTDVIDEAILAIESGLVPYETAIRRAIKQLTDSGVRRIYWESGYSKRLDSAVRQAIHDGLKALHLEMEQEIAKQIGADGWQLSAHMYSAPDHEPFQGHQFTLEEFDKLQNNQPFTDTWGNHFKGVKRIIGQWNCRHWARAIIIGKSSFAYKPETLQKYIDENKKGYDLPDGTHLTMYQCTQYQRKMETEIRRLKDRHIAAVSGGDLETAKELQSKITKLQSEYEAFSKDCGLGIKKERISVSGYKKISAK